MENSHRGNEPSNPTEWEKWTLNTDDETSKHHQTIIRATTPATPETNICCGNAAGTPQFGPCENKSRTWAHFVNIQSCNSKCWPFPRSATSSKWKSIGLDNFLKWQKWCEWVFSWIYCPWSCVAKKAIHIGMTCSGVAARILCQTTCQVA